MSTHKKYLWRNKIISILLDCKKKRKKEKKHLIKSYVIVRDMFLY